MRQQGREKDKIFPRNAALTEKYGSTTIKWNEGKGEIA
jgi:hypothetical protein